MNGLKNVDTTDREYSPAPTDDLVIFWRSKVKGQGQGIDHVDAGSSKFIFS